MSAEKLSISLDAELAAAVRAAAAEQGSSVSMWLAGAAAAQIRRRNLQIALDVVAAEDGPLGDDEIDRLITEARRTSTFVVGSEGAA